MLIPKGQKLTAYLIFFHTFAKISTQPSANSTQLFSAKNRKAYIY